MYHHTTPNRLRRTSKILSFSHTRKFKRCSMVNIINIFYIFSHKNNNNINKYFIFGLCTTRECGVCECVAPFFLYFRVSAFPSPFGRSTYIFRQSQKYTRAHEMLLILELIKNTSQIERQPSTNKHFPIRFVSEGLLNFVISYSCLSFSIITLLAWRCCWFILFLCVFCFLFLFMENRKVFMYQLCVAAHTLRKPIISIPYSMRRNVRQTGELSMGQRQALFTGQ